MLKRQFIRLASVISFIVITISQLHAQQLATVPGKDKTAYLFVYFTGNDLADESIHFAISKDGFHYFALNGNRPVIESKTISSSGGVRDPHILRSQDGKSFYMVATDMASHLGWDANRAMVLLQSTDLVHWKSAVINIQKTFKGYENLKRVWAPQTIFDAQAKKYMIYWSMKTGDQEDRIYYAYANPDFTALEGEPKLLFLPKTPASNIDADIIYKDGLYYLFRKSTGADGPGTKVATTANLTSGDWQENDNFLQPTKEDVEGSSVFPLNNTDSYIMMYDLFKSHGFQFSESRDLQHFTVVDSAISMDFKPRHGTVIAITRAELKSLIARWGKPAAFPAIDNNPVLAGFYADPDIIYSEKTKRFYIYPTSDGFTDWLGTYFKSFSSTDLVNWKDEGMLLDLKGDVSWADVRAWAPTMQERKINGKYKYFYYFCAEQKIGVAVGDNPSGPLKDLGKPLISERPASVHRGGQTIDPDVFHDPRSGKYYLYWGNGYMIGAELNDDMVSLDQQSITELTPYKGYNEGSHVFYRKGIYYFLWSEHDTRDPNYQVHYGMATSPLGKMTIPDNNIVVIKDTAAGIYGTGHNSTIQIPGRDEWYLVYHRFNYPNGIHMGQEAGYNREVCIDKMEFNADGTIRQVIPTHKGIDPVKVK